MCSHLLHGCSPKVVQEEVGEGGMGAQVPVLFDGRDVIEDKAAPERVPVDGAGHHHHQRAVHPAAQVAVPCKREIEGKKAVQPVAKVAVPCKREIKGKQAVHPAAKVAVPLSSPANTKEVSNNNLIPHQ